MADKRINDLQARSSFDATCNVPVDDASQSWRTTGAQIKAYIQAAIAPLATLGDILFASTAGAPTALAGNTSATKKFLSQTGNGSASAAPVWAQPAMSDITGTASSSQVSTATFVAPTIQKFLTGSGTYTTPTSPRVPAYIKVRMVGGGGGGGGSCNLSGGGTPGGNGGDTTFGTSLLSAGGGGGGPVGGAGGTAGTASLGTGPIGTALTGSRGGTTLYGGSATVYLGSIGGTSALGGAGCSGYNAAGIAAAANTGSGGGGAGAPGVGTSGAGGGSGAFVEALIAAPTTSYAYAVGAAGAAGGAGTGGYNGGAGAAGYIEVTEFYQ